MVVSMGDNVDDSRFHPLLSLDRASPQLFLEGTFRRFGIMTNILF